MRSLRIRRQIHIHHRKHHPLPARRNLRIAHPLHPLQIRKRHRPLPRSRPGSSPSPPTACPNATPPKTSRTTKPSKYLHRASLLPPPPTTDPAESPSIRAITVAHAVVVAAPLPHVAALPLQLRLLFWLSSRRDLLLLCSCPCFSCLSSPKGTCCCTCRCL